MRKLVNTLISSLPRLFDVFVFIVFIIAIFAVLGIQIFKGEVYKRCRLSPVPEIPNKLWLKDESITQPCSDYPHFGGFGCPGNLTCGNPLTFDISLKDDGVYENANIQFGMGFYSNFLHACLGVF